MSLPEVLGELEQGILGSPVFADEIVRCSKSDPQRILNSSFTSYVSVSETSLNLLKLAYQLDNHWLTF